MNEETEQSIGASRPAGKQPEISYSRSQTANNMKCLEFAIDLRVDGREACQLHAECTTICGMTLSPRTEAVLLGDNFREQQRRTSWQIKHTHRDPRVRLIIVNGLDFPEDVPLTEKMIRDEAERRGRNRYQKPYEPAPVESAVAFRLQVSSMTEIREHLGVLSIVFMSEPILGPCGDPNFLAVPCFKRAEYGDIFACYSRNFPRVWGYAFMDPCESYY